MNYFELYELPVSIKIEKKLLSEKYFALQKKFHPDFFTLETEFEQAEALELSSAVNKAFKIFKSEDETIKYILQLKGLLQEEEKYQLPPDFLMEVMELNENFSDESAAQIETFGGQLHEEVKTIIENYNDAFVTNGQLLQLKDYYYKKKYLQRILDRITD
jgi:molecular chaperone HscB